MLYSGSFVYGIFLLFCKQSDQRWLEVTEIPLCGRCDVPFLFHTSQGDVLMVSDLMLFPNAPSYIYIFTRDLMFFVR